MMLEQFGRPMTFSGACLAAGCGAAGTLAQTAPATMQMPVETVLWGLGWNQLGILFGMLVGASGLLIQWYFAHRRRQEEHAAHRLDMQIKRAELSRLTDPASHITLIRGE